MVKFAQEVNNRILFRVLILKILIADEDAVIARIYTGALASRGHKVTIAYDAETCLKIYGRRLQEIYLNEPAYAHIQPFDTVILDYRMPERDGLEIAKEILAINSRQRIIFFLLMLNAHFQT